VPEPLRCPIPRKGGEQCGIIAPQDRDPTIWACHRCGRRWSEYDREVLRLANAKLKLVPKPDQANQRLLPGFSDE
jgi:hypothetical protein